MLGLHVKRTFTIYWFVGFVVQLTSCESSLINFGGSPDESKQAEYYMTVDSGFPNTSPTEDLKRTQRSFWKKLFKNGWFGDEDCNGNCNYDAGDGNNYGGPPFAEPSPQVPPFRPLQWRPFQPWFRGNCQRCGYQGNTNYPNGQDPIPYNNNYGNNPRPQPTYDNSEPNGNTYIPDEDNNDYNKQDQPPYETVPDKSKEENKPEYTATDPPYEPASGLPENSNTQAPESKDNYDLQNLKIPQILYQPIIYVSPQYQEHGLNQLKVKNDQPDKETYTENQVPAVGYADISQTHNGVNYTTGPEAAANESSKDTNTSFNYNTGSHHLNICASNPYAGRSNGNQVSTVSTVYTVITPPHTDIRRDDCVPESQQAGPLKYSLFSPNGVSTPGGYRMNPPPALPLTIMPLTLDDQPYRVCPELFEEYNRRLNKITPPIQAGPSACSSGNTFINAQLITY